MKTFNLALLFALLVMTSTSVMAQNLHLLAPGYPGGTEVVYLSSPAHPSPQHAGSDPLPGFWVASSAHTASSIGGGVAINPVTRRVYSSDGYTLWQESMRRFPPYAPDSIPAPAPMKDECGNSHGSHPVPGSGGGLVGSGPVATVIGSGDPPTTTSTTTITVINGNGQVPGPTPAWGTCLLTGLSVDAAGGSLFACNPAGFGTFDLNYPYAAQGPVVMPSFAHGAFTGIAYDGSDDTLWLCDSLATVYQVRRDGTLLQSIATPVPGPVTGIAVDRSTANTSPHHVWITNGSDVVDALSYGISVSVGSSSRAYGLAFSADGQFSFGGTGGGTDLFIRQDRPSANGFGLGVDIIMETTPPVIIGRQQQAVLLWDSAPQTQGVPFSDGWIRMHPAFGANIVWISPPSNTGQESISLPDYPAGVSVSFQFGMIEFGGGLPGGSPPTEWTLSDCLTLTFALP